MEKSKHALLIIKTCPFDHKNVPFLQSKVPFFVFLIALLHTALFAL